MFKIIISKSPIAITVLSMILHSSAHADYVIEHVFSVNDILGAFNGTTYGTSGAYTDSSIICGLSDEVACAEINDYLDKSGVRLYPVDSEFGFHVIDFLGAKGKFRDNDYAEGFAGNEPGGGIRLSNAPTLKYKVKAPLGTWCQGIGGTSVKCETEHYTAMEHALTCYETIPYKYADPVTGDQKILSNGNLTFDCANAALDDHVLVLENGQQMDRLVNATPCEEDDVPNLPGGCQIKPNDKTDMLNNIALSTDYSMQLKDDGKALYGWGGIHKRPNDLRMYVRLALPDEWKEEDAENYTVTKAYLEVDHLVTNNPNDQIRPEDLENEAATGRKPSFRVEGSGSTEVWKSTIDCYEGDGDFIDGDIPATEIGSGTVLRNMPFALDKNAEPGTEAEDAPYALSADLFDAYTNGFYTTINRDPFEWSYVSSNAQASGIYNFVGTPFPKTADEQEAEGLTLVSGPRWRLKANKFGQDLPGLEIPKIECSAPPFKSDNVKYEVGERVTTVINLLDWDDAEDPSPLATSKGWVDVNENDFVTIAGYSEEGVPYTTNGLPMTNDFDVAFYVKGDSKSTAIYSAKLVLAYEGQGVTPPPTDIDVALVNLAVPSRTTVNTVHGIDVSVINNGPATGASGTVNINGVSSRGEVIQFNQTFNNLPVGIEQTYPFTWTSPSRPTTMTWTATVTAEDDKDVNNNTTTATTRVRR